MIETIADVHFGKLNRPKGGVSEQNFTKDAVKSMAKLHGLQSCKRKSVIIDIIPTVVTNPSGPSITLRYNTRRRKSKARETFGNTNREHNPLTLLNHIREFFVKKVNIFMA